VPSPNSFEVYAYLKKHEISVDFERNYKALNSLRIKLIHEETVYMLSNKTIGSVLVVGGGITGMQSALDLANAGYYVYLVERSGAIGGAMAQLDKTFPTNDCSM